jgi:hypothetical protein
LDFGQKREKGSRLVFANLVDKEGATEMRRSITVSPN